MKYIEYISIIFLFIISLICTDGIVDIIKSKDPIMINIQDINSSKRVESVNAVIKDNEIIPGKTGCEVDINKSYKEMKKINQYSDMMLRYKDLIPEITINNIYNKYITAGNNYNRNVSIVVYIKNNLEDINKINTKLNIFLDSNIFDNGKLDISNNKKIYNGGTNNNYDDITIEWVNGLIENYNKPKYCLNRDKNDNNLIICSRNRMHTISPNIEGSNIYELKKNINSGSIIYFDEKDISKINTVVNYLLKKGFNIVYLDELLSEGKCS